uniref:Uncharacterized protein n=1 Tax=Romanomermis culicivorax TaxID=13658 RepID=A0A915KWA9_ROMCU
MKAKDVKYDIEQIVWLINKRKAKGVEDYPHPQDKLPFGDDNNWRLLWEEQFGRMPGIQNLNYGHIVYTFTIDNFLNEMRVLDDFFHDPANLLIVSINPIGFQEENFVEDSLDSLLAFPSLLDTAILEKQGHPIRS